MPSAWLNEDLEMILTTLVLLEEQDRQQPEGQ